MIKDKGFTLIEILIGLAILGVLSTVGILNLTSFRAGRSIRANMEEIESALLDARERSRTQEEGYSWGMRFSNAGDPGTYELFRGTLYDADVVRRAYNLSSGVLFSEPHSGNRFDLSFQPASGAVSGAKAISLIHPGAADVLGDLILSSFGSVATRLHKGILGYWHFDEDSGSSLFDAAPGGYDAALQFGALRRMPCKAGGCVLFDGVDDYVSGVFSKEVSEFTISGWAYFIDLGNSGAVFSAYSGSAGVFYGRFLSASRRPNFYTLPFGGSEHQLTAPDSVSLNEWHHLAYVYDGAMKRIYVDGAEVASAALPNATFSFSSFEIGRSEGAAGRVFEGMIDEVRFYGRALAPSEIREAYNELR